MRAEPGALPSVIVFGVKGQSQMIKFELSTSRVQHVTYAYKVTSILISNFLVFFHGQTDTYRYTQWRDAAAKQYPVVIVVIAVAVTAFFSYRIH